MDTGRVGACHKLENKRRKFLIVINDVVKNKFDVYSEYLDNAHAQTDHSFEKSKMFVRRALVRQKVLQKCMKMRRQNLTGRKDVFGRYGGRPIESFSRDIESFIAYNHPKMRRQRYLQKLLDESLEKGTILKKNVVESRVASWLERSYTKFKLKKAKREKTNLEPIKEDAEKPANRLQARRSDVSRLPVLTNPFYSGPRVPVDEQETVEADVLTLADDVDKLALDGKQQNETSEKTREQNNDPSLDPKKRTLVLPPIKTTKAMVVT